MELFIIQNTKKFKENKELNFYTKHCSFTAKGFKILNFISAQTIE